MYLKITERCNSISCGKVIVLQKTVIVNIRLQKGDKILIANVTDYGKRIRMRLVELNKSQKWLVNEVKERTGLYFDSSYLNKIMNGSEKSVNITSAINEILEIEEAQ